MNNVFNKIIDIHGHIGAYNPEYMGGSAEDLIQLASIAGIQETWISSIEAFGYKKFKWDEAWLYKGNEQVHQACMQHDCLKMWVVLHPEKKESWEQAKQLLSMPHVVGIKLHPTLHEYRFTDHADVLLAFAEEHHACILTHSYDDDYCHPADIASSISSYYTKNYGKESSKNKTDNPFSSNIPIIMAHIGLSKNRENRLMHIDALKKYPLPNLYLDTSSHNICFNGVLEKTVQALGANTILFGTDSLLHHPSAMLARIIHSNLPANDKNNIVYNNAQRIRTLRFSIMPER